MDEGSKTVKAYPTKAFFVKMLTRDIPLEDAILDLLDNCVDGILRTKWSNGIPQGIENPYEGYYAEITLDKSKFTIVDNCGGIPRNIAEDYAFRMGKTNFHDEN
jgi:hypothetical protein